jgi:acyl carrier protein
MRNPEEIYQAVVTLLVKKFGLAKAQVRPEALLGQDLDLDSIDAIDLAVHVEQEHGLLLREDDLKQLRTVQDVVDVLQRKVQAGAPDGA